MRSEHQEPPGSKRPSIFQGPFPGTAEAPDLAGQVKPRARNDVYTIMEEPILITICIYIYPYYGKLWLDTNAKAPKSGPDRDS